MGGGLKLLLDTHALLWALGEPDRLSSPARAAIENPANVRLVSAATAWEIATKLRLGRLPNARVVIDGYQRHLELLRAEELAISTSHALLAGRLESPHRDPFDRMLAAQSLVEGARLVTGDPVLRDLGAAVLW